MNDWGLDEDLVDVAALLTSEVVTNALLHARTPFTVTRPPRAKLDPGSHATLRSLEASRPASGCSPIRS